MKASTGPFAARMAACCAVLTGLVAGSLAVETARAATDDYPNRPIRILVPTGAGSVSDIAARLLAPHMAETLGQNLVVENVPGAGGIVGTRQLVRAPKDGYTLAMINNNHVINPSIYKDLQFDSLKDIQPIGNVGSTPLVLVTGLSTSMKDLKDLLTAARQKPGALTYGSTGNGTVGHLAGVLLTIEGQVELKHIPYKAVGQQITDLMGGQIDIVFTGLASGAAQIEAGKLRALGVSSTQRAPMLPDVPTLAEQGVPDYDFEGWMTLIGPAGLPQPVVDKLNAALNAALQRGDVRQALAKSAVVISTGTSGQAAQFLAAELDKHARLMKRGGATLD